MSVKLKYIQPRNMAPAPEVPSLTYEGQVYQSGDEISLPADERDRLSNWFVFEQDGEEVAPDAAALPEGTSAPATTLSGGSEIKPDVDQNDDKTKR